jgi:IS30 family transposase
MQSITDAYMDYNQLSQLLTDLEENQVTRENIYETIMKKEKNAINLMNRIAEEKTKTKEEDSLFLNKTITQIFNTSITHWLRIYHEIVDKKQYDIKMLFYDEDRKIYTGIILVLIALFLFFSDISN